MQAQMISVNPCKSGTQKWSNYIKMKGFTKEKQDK